MQKFLEFHHHLHQKCFQWFQSWTDPDLIAFDPDEKQNSIC